MKKAKKPVGTKPAVKKSLTKPKRDVEEYYFTARSDSRVLGDRHPYANEHAEVPTAE